MSSARAAAIFIALAAFAALAGSAIISCKPNLEDTVSIITTPRVLVVRSENDAGEAEFGVGEGFKMTALYVDVSAPMPSSPLTWALCNQPKPLAELGPVSPRCLETAGDWFTPLGVGNPVNGSMPVGACHQFGPDPITPQQRPVDPDPTGGYYQPVQLLAPGTNGPNTTIGEVRIVCILASPSQDTRTAFTAQYLRNRNPVVASLGVNGEPTPWVSISEANAAPNRVAVGRRVALEVAWPACPPPAPSDGGTGLSYTPCDGAEHYLLLDTTSQALVDRREAIAVAWYATGGAFAVDRSGRAGSDSTTTSDNSWQAPSVAGPVTMWVVLRDERGGAGWTRYEIDVH